MAASRPLRPGVWVSLLLVPTFLLLLTSGHPALCIEVVSPSVMRNLNGSNVTLPCTLVSCYTMDSKLINVHWFYSENATSKRISLFSMVKGSPSYVVSNQFRGRLEWSGDVRRGSASLELLRARIDDSGVYNCSARHLTDKRKLGFSTMKLIILTEIPREDKTLVILVGGCVGGAVGLALLACITCKLVNIARARGSPDNKKDPLVNSSPQHQAGDRGGIDTHEQQGEGERGEEAGLAGAGEAAAGGGRGKVSSA
ncbi:sodium channel regulatory subunit beta-2-like isoform X2 [Petromyzon marinus]|uniref:Sodium channel subunit beta-2-like n=1 Tax=Petromyzon marinus TaxID=7757 RepID=A0AAJ7TQ57_PETMA|nr:sodium channel subunit beta-2-like [Petromyzon marinus]XP_032820608.1 sodium channel subunit beta-2-like [Petromyzon marinus]